MDVKGPTRITKGSIQSLKSLSNVLSIPESDIKTIMDTPCSDRYRRIEVAKHGGGVRVVYDPSRQIRLIQRRINNRIFKVCIGWPSYLYGSIPQPKKNPNKKADNGSSIAHQNRDYVACAEMHCNARSILKIDIENFYENIHRDEVFDIFKKVLKCSDIVSKCLTEICCYENRVVQGALTSSYLAALCLHDVEHVLVKKLIKRQLVYTRLVDDITVSSKVRSYNFNNAESHIKEMLLKKDLPLNRKKTMVVRAGDMPLVVHGLIVDGEKPRLASSEVAKIRASIHNIKKAATTNNFRTTIPYRRQYFRALGRVNRLARLAPRKHKVILKKIQKIRPMAGRADFQNVIKSLRLMNKSKDASARRYVRNYDLTRYRISLLSKSYVKRSEALLDILNKFEKPHRSD